MAELTSMQAAVLQVLSWQSPNYLCSPYASAFVSQGIEDVDGINEAFVQLQEMGFVEFFTVEESTDIIQVERDIVGEPVTDPETGNVIPVKDEDGNLIINTVTQTVDSGWVITDAGRSAIDA